MAKKKKQDSGADLIENPEVLQERLTKAEQFVEKNKQTVIIVLSVIAVAIAGFFGYRMWLQNQEEEAQRQMFQAQYYFEMDSLKLALYGDAQGNYGFIEIMEDFGGTKAANLAHFYAGAALLKMNSFEEALEHLEEFSSDDILVQARAFALQGDAYMELGNYVTAASRYSQAADYKPNKEITPIYLYKTALAYEAQEDYESALEAYENIVNNYPQSAYYQDARKHAARLSAAAG